MEIMLRYNWRKVQMVRTLLHTHHCLVGRGGQSIHVCLLALRTTGLNRVQERLSTLAVPPEMPTNLVRKIANEDW